MTWLDEQDSKKVDAGLAAFRELRDKGNAIATGAYDSSNGDELFAYWLYLVDMRAVRTVGVCASDLSDWMSRDSYDAGDSPRTAFHAALENDDTFSMMMGGE